MLDPGVWRNIRKFVGIRVLPRLTRLRMLMCRGLCVKRFELTGKCVVWAHAIKSKTTHEPGDADIVTLMCRGLCLKRFHHTGKCGVWTHANKTKATHEQSDANIALINTASTEKHSAGKQGQCLFWASTHPCSRHFSARALRLSTFAINPSRLRTSPRSFMFHQRA